MTTTDSITKVCMLAGKIMLASGAETYRVEDTMNRIAAAYGLDDAQSYATPTGINFSKEQADPANFMRISKRTTDLHKIAEVNKISRSIAAGNLEIKEAYLALKELETRPFQFSNWLQIIAAAISSGCFTIMFGGSWTDFLPAMIAGGLGFTAMLFVDGFLEIRFIAEFTASLFIAMLAVLFISLGIGVDLDKIIIGAVMPLVPGLHITNAIRDLMAGHLVAGVSKGVEATLTAFAIGAGVAAVVMFI
ncbi:MULTISPECIES: threonine/serine exporter family protein [unclassified Virgibacillus]|uniref:threonine/serine exporter family protein n=1 Tax=unclassified Virgibacillus TaxID=2620237 RepID=UPI0024DE3598|nr:threonine/serine exporter family protein [Virgibacillus sp. LDC-1]